MELVHFRVVRIHLVAIHSTAVYDESMSGLLFLRAFHNSNS